MKKVCEAMTEETASEAPQGRWSPKQIISHISGPDGIGLMPAITLILEQDIRGWTLLLRTVLH